MAIGPDDSPFPLRPSIPVGKDTASPSYMEEIGGPNFSRYSGSIEDFRRCFGPVRGSYASLPIVFRGGGALPGTSEKLASPQPQQRLRPPAWLHNSYRPRALTEAGLSALEALHPRDGKGYPCYPTVPLASMEEHREVLAVSYVGLDMIQRGHAFEVNGSVYPISMLPHRDSIRAATLLFLVHSDQWMDELELLVWLAIGRAMTMAQIISLDPENASNNVAALREMKASGLVRSHPVPMGLGTIDVWQLSPIGWRLICNSYPEVEERGFGPMPHLIPTHDAHTNRIMAPIDGGLRMVHPLLQTDAIIWFAHQLKEVGASVSGIFLEKYLRAECGNRKDAHYLDFRFHYDSKMGIQASFDVEVIGVGNRYREAAMLKRIREGIAQRSFSGASDRIEFGQHISIGR